MIDGDKSGDYGSAIRGDEMTVAFGQAGAIPEYPGGSEAIDRLRAAENINRVAVGVGVVVIVALVFFCFRLAFDGFHSSAAVKNLSGQQYLDDAPGAASVAVAGPAGVSPRVTSVPSIAYAAAPAAPALPAPVARPVTPGTTRFMLSAQGRADALSMLSDCRAAYTLSGQLSSKWLAAVDAANQAPKLTRETADDSAQPIPSAIDSPSTAMTAEDWRTIDTQMQGITTMVTFATRPNVYPDGLQETSASLGREMNTYLQTLRVALETTDSEQRGVIVGRADAHREKAGELLSRLEGAIRSGTMPATPAGIAGE